MSRIRNNLLKTGYLASTLVFALSTCYLLVISLYNAGQSWLIITPVSAYSAQVLLLLFMWYLFVVYRGIAGDQKIDIEHPFTSTGCYQVFYKLTPLLGAVAGIGSMWEFDGAGGFWLATAGGAVFATFLVWIFVDPLIGLLEMLLPASRRNRRQRTALARQEYKKQALARQSLLQELDQLEHVRLREWDKSLTPVARQLASMVCGQCGTSDHCRSGIVDIGVRLWQYGGLECMRFVHTKAIELCHNKCKFTDEFDCISLWWQGIGTWRAPLSESLQ